jgi:hypothetical protein
MSSYAQTILADSPSGYWTFDETSGDTIEDSSGNARHGAISGHVTLGARGAFPGSRGAAFDGTTGTIELEGGPWGGRDELTVEAWVNVKRKSSDAQAIVSSVAAGRFVQLQMCAKGDIPVYTDAGTLRMPVLTQEPIGVWRHVTLVVVSGDTRLYVDGAEVGTPEATRCFEFGEVRSARRIRIGSGYRGGRFFHGRIDHVAIYDHVLTEERIHAHLEAARQSTARTPALKKPEPSRVESTIVPVSPASAPGSPGGNLIRLAGESVLPGASLLLDGNISGGGLHVIAGLGARALLGPLGFAGWLYVAANSYATSVTGQPLHRAFTGGGA